MAKWCPPCQVRARREAADRRRATNPEAYREYKRQYAQRNPRYQQAWAERNPEKAAELQRRAVEAQRARDQANPAAAAERRRQSWQRYRQAIADGRLRERPRDPDKQRRASDLRRARKYGAEYEEFDPREVFDRDGWMCSICHVSIDDDLRWPDPMSVSLDHVIPLSKGGAHKRANTAAAHLGCNWRKHASLPVE